MPTTTERAVVPHPQTIITYPSNTARKSISNVQSPRSSIARASISPPSHKVQFLDETSKGFSTNKKCNGSVLRALFVLLTIFIIGLIVTAIVVPFVVMQTTTSNPTTTTQTTTTSILNCIWPLVLATTTCVNLFLDDNNCGTVGTVCSIAGTHCSAGICNTVPTVQLTGYSAVWIGGYNGSIDDNVFTVNLPFSITLYNTATQVVQVTTNGVLCFTGCSNAYRETDLPASVFSGITVLPYWDDLYISAKTWQGIYYGSYGTAPNRQLIFEYYLSFFGSPRTYTQFQVTFFEQQPNIVQVAYFQADDLGANATVGVQASGTGPTILFSYHQRNSSFPNFNITFNTASATYVVA